MTPPGPRLLGPRVLGASFRLAALTFVADPQWLVPSIVAPVVFALAAYVMYAGSGGVLVLYAVLGAGMMSMWGQTLYGSGWAVGEDRYLGTLEPVLGAPASYLWVVAGRVLWNTILGLLGGGIVYAVIATTYGRPLPLQHPVEFTGLFVVIIGTLAAVGLVLTATFVFTRYAGFIQNIGEFAFYVVSGCMFPVILLPFWVTPVSLIFPATWALDALRYASIPGYGGLPWGFTGDLAGALGLTLVYLAIAGTLFHRVERHVLSAGTADEY